MLYTGQEANLLSVGRRSAKCVSPQSSPFAVSLATLCCRAPTGGRSDGRYLQLDANSVSLNPQPSPFHMTSHRTAPHCTTPSDFVVIIDSSDESVAEGTMARDS